MDKLFNLIEDNKEHLSSQLYKDMIEAFAELRTQVNTTQVNTNKHWYCIRFYTVVLDRVYMLTGDDESPKYKLERKNYEKIAYTLEQLTMDDVNKRIFFNNHLTSKIEFVEDQAPAYDDNGDVIRLGPTYTLTWFDKVDI
jgi:hypothetical protein